MFSNCNLRPAPAPVEYFQDFYQTRATCLHQGPFEFSHTRHVLQTAFWKNKPTIDELCREAFKLSPSASITDSLFCHLLVSLDWNQLFQVRQTSSSCFPVPWRPPGMGTCQQDLGKADYWGPGLRQIQNINSARAHLSLQFLYFIVFPQDFTPVTQHHKFSTMTTHTHAHTFFPSLSWPQQSAFITLVGRARREYSLTSKVANSQSNYEERR